MQTLKNGKKNWFLINLRELKPWLGEISPW